MKNKVKRKPTNREMASAIIEINSKVNHCLEIAKNLDNVIGLYIEMKGDLEYFNKHIDKKLKKEKEEVDESKGNEEIDGGNIPTNTENESSRTKGIRQE